LIGGGESSFLHFESSVLHFALAFIRVNSRDSRGRGMSDLERYTVTMPRELFEAFDAWNARKGYKNRSEAIRDLVRAALVREQAGHPGARVAASLTLVYDHHVRALTEKITQLQHDHEGLVVSALHVHLDHHNCLEVIVLRGRAGRIEALADSLACIKGVKHAQLAITSEGKSLR
jgi:CopG family nickel-responsive transcriptional regulator